MHKDLITWMQTVGVKEPKLVPLCGDASSRAYYRLENENLKGIVMDASAQKEVLGPFMGVAFRLMEKDIRIPIIKAYESNKGFMFLEDIGSTHLLDKVGGGEMELYYDKAIQMLALVQSAPSAELDVYDKGFLMEEMNLMPWWYLREHLGKTPECFESKVLLDTFSAIASEVLAQPQGIFVHRDYHSRNLMINSNDDMVVIDFQDAKEGALTYDLASLLRDVYVELEDEEVLRLIKLFKDLRGIEVDDATFMRWFDFTALQRHIKILGIFARLAIRDGKEDYLNDIPLTLKYVLKTAKKYEETQAFAKFLEDLHT